MKRKFIDVGLSLLFVGITTLIVGAGKPATDAPATSTIGDAHPVTGVPFRIGSDSLGAYRNGVNSVLSQVQGIGDWELDTKSSSLRKIRIDFGDPVAGTSPNPPFQAANVPGRFISKCAAWGFFMPGMAVGQQLDCPLAMSIDYAGVTYAIRSNENYAGTQPVRWTCLARNATKCISWEMVPSATQADGEQKIAMQLIRIASNRRETDQLLGQFYMSFKVAVTTP
jgi:hypothetical protein